MTTILLAILAFITLLVIAIGLLRMWIGAARQAALAAWADLQVQLQARHALLERLHEANDILVGIPANLLATLNLMHREALARRGTPTQRGQHERAVSDALAPVLSSIQSHPHVASNVSVSGLINGLTVTEAAVRDTSRRYDLAARVVNKRISNLLARPFASWFRYGVAEPFWTDNQ